MENSVRCVVGFCMNGLLSGVFWGAVGVTLSVVTQLVKFAMVLLLTYMIAMGIFYLWEHNLNIRSGSHMLMPPRRASKQTSTAAYTTSTPRDGSLLKYPFVVEIPSKVSLDSLTKKKNAKAKEKRNSIGSPRGSLVKQVEEVEEQILAKTELDLQRNLEEEEPDDMPGVSGIGSSESDRKSK